MKFTVLLTLPLETETLSSNFSTAGGVLVYPGAVTPPLQFPRRVRKMPDPPDRAEWEEESILVKEGRANCSFRSFQVSPEDAGEKQLSVIEHTTPFSPPLTE